MAGSTRQPEPQRQELRAMFNRAVVEKIAQRVARHHRSFARDRFVEEVVADFPSLGLMDRSQRIARGLREHLPADYPAALRILLASIGRPDDSGGVEGFDGFCSMPFLNFVGAYGLEHPELSLEALGNMTLHISGEFDIRPYLLRYPDIALAAVRAWARDPDWRRRRLASEGMRPRLPWGLRLKPFIQDPSPVIEILDVLRADPHPVVRRSVANNLNDISRDNPAVAVATARRWLASGSEETRALVRHALRTLIKQGHPEALELLGFGDGQDLHLRKLRLKCDRITLGQTLEFSFELMSKAKAAKSLSIDYRVHHLRANGKHTPKAFKLACRRIEPGQVIALEARHPIVPITTRRYYAGLHRLEVVVNGRSMGTVEFTLRIPSKAATRR